jgi:hypothetical protein
MTRVKDVAAVNDQLTRLRTEIARNDFAGDGRYSKNIREL